MAGGWPHKERFLRTSSIVIVCRALSLFKTHAALLGCPLWLHSSFGNASYFYICVLSSFSSFLCVHLHLHHSRTKATPAKPPATGKSQAKAASPGKVRGSCAAAAKATKASVAKAAAAKGYMRHIFVRYIACSFIVQKSSGQTVAFLHPS